MILRYTPQDGPPQMWDLAAARFLTSEAELVERATELEWGQVNSRNALVIRKSPTALRAMAWVLLKRQTPTLRFSAFDPAIEDVSVKLSGDDVLELRAEADEAFTRGNITEEQFEEAVQDIADLLDPDAMASPVPGPKEPAAPAPAEAWAPTASPTAALSGSGLSSTASP